MIACFSTSYLHLSQSQRRKQSIHQELAKSVLSGLDSAIVWSTGTLRQGHTVSCSSLLHARILQLAFMHRWSTVSGDVVEVLAADTSLNSVADLTLCTLCVANVHVLSESNFLLASKIILASLKAVHALCQGIRNVLLDL